MADLTPAQDACCALIHLAEFCGDPWTGELDVAVPPRGYQIVRNRTARLWIVEIGSLDGNVRGEGVTLTDAVVEAITKVKIKENRPWLNPTKAGRSSN